MSELDNLLGSRISLISQVDVRYDGVLFSINAKESSIVLKDVRCLGTEDRVSEAAKRVPASHGVLAYVTFPGHDIKDLYLHDYDSNTAAAEPTLPEPPKAKPTPQRHTQPAGAPAARSTPAQQSQKPASAQRAPAPAASNPPPAPVQRNEKHTSSTIGTGEHLLHLRVKKDHSEQSQGADASAPKGIFDFAVALSAFNKTEVMDSVAKDAEKDALAIKGGLYKKDDFFDNLSCDMLDREMGRKTHMTNSEERSLNQSTFGAVALQGSYRGRGRGRGRFQSGGRGGHGGGPTQQGQHGQGHRGGGRGGAYRGGGRGGRGRGYSNQNNAAGASA